MRLFLLLLFILLQTTTDLSAQVLKHKCHSAPHEIEMVPLTAAQKALVKRGIQRSDTLDILNYDIELAIIDFVGERIDANCKVTFTAKVDGIDQITLDLLQLNISAIVDDNNMPMSYDYDNRFLTISFSEINIGDTISTTIFYDGTPQVDPTGFGGLDFRDGYAYNLGIGLGSNPYNFGRSWFPCFDNFVERSTFDIDLISADGRKGYAIGKFLGQTTISGDTIRRAYRMSKPIATYQAGVAVSRYAEVNDIHDGLERDLPTLIVANPADTSQSKTAFTDLGTAIDVFEYWYGACIWDQVGFVMTTVGAMEHPTLVAYPDSRGVGPNDFDQNRLMAHELCHFWWGDQVNMNSPADMWFKEGNAEYGAHLFTEGLQGHEAFIKQVKDNHYLVLSDAGFDDDGFWPLSGIPFEHTYGTHTYNKGASMIHNMRAYMGDSLFRIGQQAMLDRYTFQAVDAAQYRDQLAAATGLDMNPYFDNWIFNPGWAGYEMDSMDIVSQGNEFVVTSYIQQKLRKVNRFHNDTPLEITFYDENRNSMTRQVMVGGEFPTPEVTLPFEPVFAVINQANRLNLAQFNDQATVTETGRANIIHVDFPITVSEISDTALINVEHYWLAPDPLADPSQGKISVNHFWRYNGIFPENFNATVRMFLENNTRSGLNSDIPNPRSDSLMLVYREDASREWTEFPFYRISAQSNTRALFRIDSLLPGDYAYALADLELYTDVPEINIEQYKVFPNPANDHVNISGTIEASTQVVIRLFDIEGKQIFRQRDLLNAGEFQRLIDLPELATGNYILSLTDTKGRILSSNQIIIGL